MLTTTSIIKDIGKYLSQSNLGEGSYNELYQNLQQMLVTEEKELIKRKMKVILK